MNGSINKVETFFESMGKRWKAVYDSNSTAKMVGHASLSSKSMDALRPKWNNNDPDQSRLELDTWVKAATTFLQPVVIQALAVLDVGYSGRRPSWSRTKLCKCGCSPAWIVDGMQRGSYVNIEEVVS